MRTPFRSCTIKSQQDIFLAVVSYKQRHVVLATNNLVNKEINAHDIFLKKMYILKWNSPHLTNIPSANPRIKLESRILVCRMGIFLRL